MSPTPFLHITAVLLVLLGLLMPATPAAVIPIEGVSDQSVTADRAWFRIPSTLDYLESALLDGRPVPFNVTQEVVDPDFHELRVTRAPNSGGPTESRQVSFIVRASERGSTEWGLPPWTPPAIVPASTAELAPARLRFLVPGRFPTGLPISFAVWLDAPDGHALRAHALLTSPSHDPILRRRGAGSGPRPHCSPGAALIPPGSMPTRATTSIAASRRSSSSMALGPSSGTVPPSMAWAVRPQSRRRP